MHLYVFCIPVRLKKTMSEKGVWSLHFVFPSWLNWSFYISKLAGGFFSIDSGHRQCNKELYSVPLRISSYITFDITIQTDSYIAGVTLHLFSR